MHAEEVTSLNHIHYAEPIKVHHVWLKGENVSATFIAADQRDQGTDYMVTDVEVTPYVFAVAKIILKVQGGTVDDVIKAVTPMLEHLDLYQPR